MEWRCEWCGKPHAENDPPCDNCGHGSFEEAVVPAAAEGPAGNSTTVWVCTACGREHPKHAPPCSRCGNRDLERREITVTDDELSVPSYRDLLTPRYVAGVVLALALAVVLVLGLAGIVDLPGLDSGVPEVADVPGNATHASGVSLAAVESAYVERASAIRADAGMTRLEPDDRLTAVATYYNQRRVKAALADGSVPPDDELAERVGDRCESGHYEAYSVAVPAGIESGQTIGERLADRAFENRRVRFPAERGLTGVDVHAFPNGTLSVTQFAC